MIKTLSAALVAVSMLAAPALAASADKTPAAPATTQTAPAGNTAQAASEARRLGVTTLPATRTTKRSPGAWSNTSSGATRESAQERIAAIGHWPDARAARPAEKSRWSGALAT